MDGLNWTTLKTHSNDSSINKALGTHSWEINGITSFYTQFRVRQTGRNSNGDDNLRCAGFEIYGELKAV